MNRIKVTMTRKAFDRLMAYRDIHSPKDICTYLNATGGYLGKVVWIDVDENPVYEDSKYEVAV